MTTNRSYPSLVLLSVTFFVNRVFPNGKLAQVTGCKLYYRLSRPQCGKHVPSPNVENPELPGLDSNQDKQDQNLLCYRYTTG